MAMTESENRLTARITHKYSFDSMKAAVAVARRQGLGIELNCITRDQQKRRVFDTTIIIAAETPQVVENKQRVFDAGFDYEIDSRRAVRNARRLK